MSTNSALNAIRDRLSESYFDVREEEVRTAGGFKIEGKKAIVRESDGSPISIVGAGYKTIKNAELFDSFLTILGKSGLDLEGAETEVEFSHRGARTFAQIILPAHQIEVGKGDATALRIIAKNSYDGTTAFSVQAGGYRFVCSNGMVTGDDLSYFKNKHVASLDVNASAERIGEVLNTFERSRDYFDKLRGLPIDDAAAYNALAHANRNVEAMRLGLPDSRDDMPRTMRTLFDSWIEHKTKLGANGWGLYNTLTHYSTHWDAERDNVENLAAAKFRREKRVLQTLRLPTFAPAAEALKLAA